jgi:hypothetical protein
MTTVILKPTTDFYFSKKENMSSADKVRPGYSTKNKATLIRGGQAYFSLMNRLIREAAKSIQLQVYILEADETGVTGEDDSVVLEYVSSLTKALRDKYPYLRDYVALKIPLAEQDNVQTWLRGQVAVEILNDEKTAPLKVSGLQLGDVLDDVYPDAKNVTPGITWSGSNPTITVWAPTAQSVSVNLFDNSADESATNLAMTRDNETGTWSVTGDTAWDLKQYTFTVDVYAPSTGRIETNEVTDPYSILSSRRHHLK